MSHSPTSMTGFGQSTFEASGARFRVQIKSVNHRNLNLRTNLPTELAGSEADARALIEARLGRGAVELSVQLESATERDVEVIIAHKAATRVMEALAKLATEVGAPMPGLDLLLRVGDIIQIQTACLDATALAEGFAGALGEAVEATLVMRTAEGEALARDIAQRLDRLDALLTRFEEAAPLVQAAYETRLRQRLQEAMERHGIALDESRLATELVLFADKSDITEETVRARSHVAAFRALLGPQDDPLRGKRLDFLAQELGREVNTIGSKCRDAGMAQDVVDTKVELERIREQVQNFA